MRPAAAYVPALLACATLTGCATPGVPPPADLSQALTISGNLIYRERIALPPGARATVTLEDVSRADAPSRTLASQTIDLNGRQLPIPFRLEVARASLSDQGRYSLRATIRDAGGGIAWTTDTARLIDPSGGDQALGDVILVRAGAR